MENSQTQEQPPQKSALKPLNILTAIGFGVEMLWLISLLNVQSEGPPPNPNLAPTFLIGYISLAILALLSATLAVKSIRGTLRVEIRAIAFVAIIVAALLICRAY
jgi:hypothetical protein